MKNFVVKILEDPRGGFLQTLEENPEKNPEDFCASASIRRFKKIHIFSGVSGRVIIDAIASYKKESKPPKYPQTARKTDLRNRFLNFGWRAAGAGLYPLIRSSGRAATSGARPERNLDLVIDHPDTPPQRRSDPKKIQFLFGPLPLN